MHLRGAGASAASCAANGEARVNRARRSPAAVSVAIAYNVGRTIHDRRLRRLYEYWLDRCGGRAMPARTDIDPIEMRFILGHVMLLDVLPPVPRFRVRLQGSELTWWIGRELTGRTIEPGPGRELETLAQERLAGVVSSRAPFGWIGDHAIDDIPRRYEALILPLSANGSSVDMLLAAVRCGVRAPKP